MTNRKKLAEQWNACSNPLECYRIEYLGQHESHKGIRFSRIGDAYLVLAEEHAKHKRRQPRKDYAKRWAYRDAWREKIIACHWTERFPGEPKPNPPVPERTVYEYPPVC